MLHIQPGQQFPIMRVLKDHTDTDTNYVRAVIKNARTAATLDTVDLTDQGGRVFTGVWGAPFTTTGDLFVVIITTVYSDSGYTTKNVRYAEEAETALVAERWSLALGGGGGRAGIDWKKMREVLREISQEVFREEIQNLPVPQVVVNERKIDFDGIARKIVGAFEEIAVAMRPENYKTELNTISKQIALLFKEIGDMPRFEPTKLEPLTELINSTAKAITLEVKGITKSIEVTIPDIEEKVALVIADKVREYFKKEGVSISLVPPRNNENDEDNEEKKSNKRFSKLLRV